MAYIGFNPSQLAVAPFATKYFTGNGVTTTFTLDQSVPGANEANVEVFVENVQQNPIDAYTIGGALNNQLIFSEAPVSGAAIYVIHKGEATYNLQPSTGSVTAATLDPVLRNFTVDKFTGTGSQTAFTLTDTPYSVNSILVSVDGIVQQAGTNYTVSGTTLTFASEAPDLGSDITVVHLGFSSGNKAVMDASITPVKLSTGGPYWSTAGNFGIGQTTPTEKLHILDGRIAVQGDTTTPTTGHAFFYKQSYGATMSGYQAVIETGSAGSRTGKVFVTLDGNVGIGTNAPTHMLHIKGPYPYLKFEDTGDSGAIVDPGACGTITGYQTGSMYFDANTTGKAGCYGSFSFRSDSTFSTVLQIEGSNTSLGRLNLPYGQIKFPASQNASSDANTLDDYEEGTFLPNIRGGDTAGVTTWISRDGYYTKIGRMVFVFMNLRWSNQTGTGELQVDNLPFVTVGYAGYGAITYNSGLSYTAGYYPALWANGNSTLLRFWQTNNGSVIPIPMDTSVGEIHVTFIYTTTT
jgi:hypothetical protein